MDIGLTNTPNPITSLHDAPPLTPVEEDAIVTMVVVVVGVIVAIIALFCMGIFIDCRETKSDLAKRKHPLRLKMPPIGRQRGDRSSRNGDGRSFATDMCPNGNDPGPSGDAMV